ncbi:prevent-host-death protein [Streptomyces marincola]|uniref:prevent-host-death protein n=1 Tax=Streptomyces marincola TaxID=2878388 RepID=UPI0021002AE0|nr:prevent-host-death protein [Streptomyces marincola]
MRRNSGRAAVVDVERLRHYLSLACPAGVQAVAEADGWSILIRGLPVSADGATSDEAVDETVDTLCEYAEDWQDRLRVARHHRDNWGLVQLIGLSDDTQLAEWLVGTSR